MLRDIAPSAILVVHSQCLVHLRNRYIVGLQQQGIQSHLVLLQITTKAAHFNDARNPRQLSFDDPVLNSPESHGVEIIFISGFDLQNVLINFPQSGGDRHQFRLAQFRRDLLFGYPDLLFYELAGIEDRHALLKDDGDHRKAKAGDRTYFSHPRDIGHGHFHGIGNKLLDFLGGQGGRDGNNLNLVVRDIRYGIDG